jgi:hypothetical protein
LFLNTVKFSHPSLAKTLIFTVSSSTSYIVGSLNYILSSAFIVAFLRSSLKMGAALFPGRISTFRDF